MVNMFGVFTLNRVGWIAMIIVNWRIALGTLLGDQLKLKDMTTEKYKVNETDFMDLLQVATETEDDNKNPIFDLVRPTSLDDDEGNPDPHVAFHARDMGINVEQMIREEVKQSLYIRSRVEWLKQGDQNTKYFHWKAKARRMRNEVLGLYDANGNWCEGDSEVELVVAEYFTNLFTFYEPHEEDIDRMLACVQSSRSQQLINFLDGPFTIEEIRVAVFVMAPSKAPGLDGLPALFYQKYWDSIRGSITEACLNCLNNGASLQPVNDMFVCLIPKVRSAQRVSEFWPISLCNVVYKIVAKALANKVPLSRGGSFLTTL
ncbi:hypothetical protein Dsin_017158 [Dipteronia sinensis]|uniref:Reverse transcriptase n=1 Tax=Dipteronia sinensis TaxID=43782 RepID=A0AAE0E6F3_9ROSI|nr:hypothetical protein Dsin_017158 [Dipteronia sinensis]